LKLSAFHQQNTGHFFDMPVFFIHQVVNLHAVFGQL
jgi:hypothetical protein